MANYGAGYVHQFPQGMYPNGQQPGGTCGVGSTLGQLANGGCYDPETCSRVPVGMCSKDGDDPGAAVADEITAGVSANISLQPDQSIAIDSIVIGSSVARDFVIDDIKVGPKSILPTQDRQMPGEMFSEVALTRTTSFRPVPSTIKFTLAITNDSAADARFLCGLWVRTL